MAFQIPVTVLYGSLTALLIGVLGTNVSRLRGQKKIFIGDPPDPELQRAVRAHGNAAEWAPLQIVLLLLLEALGASSTVLHVLGGAIFVTRLMHAVGVYARSGLSTVAAGLNILLAIGMPIYTLVLRFKG